MPATTQASKPSIRKVATHNIVGQSGIAHRCKVSPQAVSNWVKRADFPEPLPGTDCGYPVWDWSEVKDWEKHWERARGGSGMHRSRRQWTEGMGDGG